MIQFVTDREIYEKMIRDRVPQTKKRLWIATADIKDMYVDKAGLHRQMVPFLQILSELLHQGVAIRLIHAKEPGPAFRQDFDRFPGLWGGIERVLCPRVHFKCVICDGAIAYFGSANLTGAGMGAKGELRRNFENGIITDDRNLIVPLAPQLPSLTMSGAVISVRNAPERNFVWTARCSRPVSGAAVFCHSSMRLG